MRNQVSAARQALSDLAARHLNWNQYLIWSEQKQHPDIPLYNTLFTFTLNGALVVEQFQRAFQCVVNEFDALRSIFQEEAGLPSRQVLPTLQYIVPLIDLSTERDPTAAFETWYAQQSVKNFRLTEPLFDSALVRLADSKYIWYLNLHHLIVDGWSGWLIYHRLREHYLGIAQTTCPPTFETAVESEQAYLDSAQAAHPSTARRFAQDVRYWEQQLKTELHPPIFHQPINSSPQIAAHHHHLNLGNQSKRIRRLLNTPTFASPTVSIGLFNWLLTILSVYVHGVSGEHTFALGGVFANRSELPEVVGPLMKEVPLYLTIERGETFRSLFEKTRVASAAAAQHRRFPYQQLALVDYRAVLNLHNWSPCADLAGAKVEMELRYPPYSTRALTVHLLNAHHSTNADYRLLFSTRDSDFGVEGDAVPAQFLNLLKSALENPDQRIADARLMDEPTQRWVLQSSAGASMRAENLYPVHCGLEACANAAPNAVAVLCGDDSLTYGELNARANQLAHFLRARGVRQRTRVAVCLGHGIEWVVTLLAIAKAGAVYIPLDPEIPTERLGRILLDADVPCMVSQTQFVDAVAQTSRELILHDTISSELGQQPLANLNLPIALSDAAYIIYTSGSIGEPRGVYVSHAALAAHIASACACYKITADDALLQFATFSFDPSLEQIWCALTSGARIVMRGKNALTATELAELVVARGVTVANLPTAYWQIITSEWALHPELLANHALRLMLIGGEPMPYSAAARWKQIALLQRVQLWNVYGPTETTVTAMFYEVGAVTGEEIGFVPIGKALPGRTAYVLDEYGNLAPPHVAGELYLGGIGLADGYWHDAALTAQRFGEHFAPALGATKLYRTGDRAYLDVAGNVVFIGRQDRQVKLRGFRIELYEVEKTLAAHPFVRECIVRLANDTNDKAHLAAYLVPTDAQAFSIDAVREFARARLPHYMVPELWSVLDALPLTLQGKVDDRRLPLPLAFEPPNRDDGALSQPEAILREIWRAVLHVEKVGRGDNFFELGGDSLNALQIVAGIERAWHIRLPADLLLTAPTLAELAVHVEQAQHVHPLRPSRRAATLLPIQPGQPDRVPFFCVHGFGGGLIGYRELARQIGSEQPFYGLLARGRDGSAKPLARVPEMAAEYIEAMRKEQAHGPYQLGGYCFGGVVAFEMACQLQAQGEKVSLVALIESYNPRRTARWHPKQFIHILANAPAWMHGYVLPMLQAEQRTKDAEIKDQDIQRIQAAERQALISYQPQFFAGELTLLRGRYLSMSALADPLMGWGNLARALRVEQVEAGHGDILQMPGVIELAKILRQHLARPQ